ncbi:MAG: hypothetical protein Q7U44_12355 [Desulfuromonadales bacterium]|nr:hypothetical protein [Desulfuromonadales bacterium]
MANRCFIAAAMHPKSLLLSQILFRNNFVMIDMQLPTPHLLSLGGRLLERAAFELLLQDALSPVDNPGRPFSA